MHSSLHRRIAALERVELPTELLTVLRTLLTPGETLRELQALRSGDGTQEWHRMAGETEPEFMARAEREAPRSDGGVARLIEVQCDGEAA